MTVNGISSASPTYFSRQQATAEDLNALFEHDAAEWRAHNLSRHGCGVVCGLAVHWLDPGKMVRVSPGYAIGPRGDEILVPEAQDIAIDCAALAPDYCDDPGTGKESGAVYLAIRYTQRPTGYRLASPEHCASAEECLPTRLCDSFEIACRVEKPRNCPPRMELPGCALHGLLKNPQQSAAQEALEAFIWRDSGCLEIDGDEQWLVLATITAQSDSRGRLVAELSYANRATLPSIQYLVDLTRLLGAQALKRQAVRMTITAINGVSSGVLTLNRGRILGGMLVAGRGLDGAQSVRFAPGAAPEIGAQIVAGSVNDSALSVDITIPIDTPLRRLVMIVETSSGLSVSSGTGLEPIVIQLVDNPVASIPAISGLEVVYRHIVLDRLQAAGITTAQAVVQAGVNNLMRFFFDAPVIGIRLPILIAYQIAVLLVQSARQWLADGAPE